MEESGDSPGGEEAYNLTSASGRVRGRNMYEHKYFGTAFIRTYERYRAVKIWFHREAGGATVFFGLSIFKSIQPTMSVGRWIAVAGVDGWWKVRASG